MRSPLNILGVLSSRLAKLMNKGGTDSLLHPSIVSRLVSGAPESCSVSVLQAEKALSDGLASMYSDDLPSFVPDRLVLLSVVSGMIDSVLSSTESLDGLLVSLSVWSYRALFPDLPVGQWAGANDSDLPDTSLMPRILSVPVWYRECDMGLFWDEANGSLGISVSDSLHDSVSLLFHDDCLAQVFVPPHVVSDDPSSVVVFDGLRRSGLSHAEACSALSLLLP